MEEWLNLMDTGCVSFSFRFLYVVFTNLKLACVLRAVP